MAKPPFPWIGSKEKIAPYILQLFPPKLTQYVEPFGGSGAVLLALPPDPNRLDIYNDLDAELVNLFSCIKECSNVLLRELKFLPIHGRKLFEYYRDFVAHKEVYFQIVQAEIECLGDRSCFTEEQAGELLPIFRERLALYDVKRAAAYYLAIRGSFSGTINSFGVKGLDVERFLKLFPPVSARLKDVPLENKNALQLIRERDKKGSLIYADPPYVKTERLYRVAGKLGRFRRFHVRLWQVLTGRDSYVVLSYNDCPFIRKLYQDWYISSFQRSNPLSQKKGSSFGELIITNYDPRPYMTSQMNLFDEPVGRMGAEAGPYPKSSTKEENSMKFNLNHDPNNKTLAIPRAALQLSGLAGVSDLILHTDSGCILLLPGDPTVAELLKTISLISAVAPQLISRLAERSQLAMGTGMAETACGACEHEPHCSGLEIPPCQLAEAGISPTPRWSPL